MVHSDNEMLFSAKNKMKFQVMKVHGGSLNVYYWVNKANLKRLHIALFQLYNILEKAKVWR